MTPNFPIVLWFGCFVVGHWIIGLTNFRKGHYVPYKDDATSFIDLEPNTKLLVMEMFKVKNDILPNVLGEFITKRDFKLELKKPFRISPGWSEYY